MELSAVVEQEEVVLTEPESEEADETFYMNRLLMVGTEGTLPDSPHINPGSSYDNVISPQIEVLPKRCQKRLLENQLVDGSLLVHSAWEDAVNKDGDNLTNVDHMTDTAAPRIKTQKRQRTCTKNVRIGQNTSPLKWLLRSSCKPYPQQSEENQQKGKSKTKITKVTSKKRQNSKDSSSKKSVPRRRVIVSHSSRGGQQSPGDKLSSSLAINKPKTGKVLNMKSIHKRNRFGETRLHTSARNGDVQSVDNMIKVGACVNVADNAGWTPLHEAVLHGHYTIVKTLLKAGAEVDHAGYNRITPLQDAVLLGNLEVTELLLKHNADPLLKNNKGEAAIDINKDLNVQNLLRKYISTTQTMCLSDQRVPIAESCVESGIEDSGRRHCREARQSAEKDEATTNQQSTKTEASVGPDAEDKENVQDSSFDGEGSSKVSPALTMPLQEGQAKKVILAGSLLAHDGSLHIQDPEHLIPDTTSSMASDSESDVTVDYIETHSSSPGHWFLSATQDFSGSLHRLVAEITRRDANSLDADPHASQSLVSAAKKSNLIRSKDSQRNITDSASKRSLDGSRDDQETVSRKKIRRISVTNKNEAFLDYLLNFDLNSVCVANSGSGNESVAKKGSDGSASYAYASPIHNNVSKNHLTASAISQKDTCASQTQIDSPVDSSVSLLAPCLNHLSASDLEEQPMVGEPLRAVMLSPLPSTGTNLESADCESPSLLTGTYRIHDQVLTCSPEPHVRLNVFEQSEVTDESLKTSRSIKETSKSVTSSPQMCVGGDIRKQKALPLLNLSSGSITKDDASELCQTNIDTVNNLPSNEMLSSSEETITPSLHLSYGNLLHSRIDKLVTPTKQVQQRQDNRDSVNSQLSCTQAPASPSKTCSIVSTEIQDGGQSGLRLVETILETEKKNTITPDVNVPEPLLVLTLPCAKDDSTDVENDDAAVSTDSDCTVVEEPESNKTTDKKVEDVAVCQLNQNDISVAIISDEEQCIEMHGLQRAPDAIQEPSVSTDSDCTAVEEPELKKTTDKDVKNVACQLNQIDVPVAIICDEEQYIEKHGLHRAPDERGTGEQRENTADPLDTGTSVSILRDLAQKPLCLLPTSDNNQESSDSVKEHNLQIAVENEEVSFTDKLISQHQKKTEISTSDVRKMSSKFKLDKHSNSVNAGWTSLHKATSTAGHVDVLEQHLHAGADVKRPSPDGVSPPHSSIFCRHYEHDTNPHDKQGSGCLPHEHKLQDNHICKTPPSAFCSEGNTSGHKKDSSGSSVLCEEMFLPLTLQEVEEKQNEMLAWSLNEPEDRDRFTVTLLETQTVLNNVFFKQHVEKIHLSKEARTTPNSIHDGQLSQALLDFASRHKYLLMLLQKQNELLKHKLKMSTDQHCSSSNTSTEISALNDPKHSLPDTDQDEEHSNVCHHNYSTSNHSHLESQSVTSNLACPSLLSERPATPDDNRISRGLNRKGVIQPEDNTLEVPLMGSSQESSLKHTRGKTSSAAKHKVMTRGSKTPKDCSLTAVFSSRSGPQQQQVHAPGLTCTRSSAEGVAWLRK
ncbi:ankyrin repeat domain-containing protein 31 isoform X1 [Astyanax mexicanus]|uniref:ankyrin repeat domain-containing protein 31 isoform X1 n=2 Tax=Astyanax mexicanus TaxID=7994 RepID=UPI0020CAFDDF|nr:ankyrin repeat domain-containing protein 31 isoform X1 [Astyanax mexicanus]